MGFQIGVGGGTFRQEADGTIKGNLMSIADARWSTEDGSRTGQIEGSGALKLRSSEPNHASITVKEASDDQNVVSLELQSVSYDQASGHWNYTGKPLDAKANRAARLTEPSLEANADRSLASTFGAATVSMDNAKTRIGPDGGPAPNNVISGTLALSLGPNVSVTAKLLDFDCVDTQHAPIFDTKAKVEQHGFDADMFTFLHGCANRASWLTWELDIGPPWSVSGQLWLGQTSPGGDYRVECRNWPGNVFCQESDFYTSGRYTDVMISEPACPAEGGQSYLIEGKSCSTVTTWVFAGNMYGSGTVWNGGIRDCSIPNIGNVEATKSMPFKREQTYQPDVGCALLLWEYGP